jgi:type II secretory pathway pseudopilin PulG
MVQPNRTAHTLTELVVVLAILVGLSCIAIPLFPSYTSTAADTTTRASIATIRDAMLLYWSHTKNITLDGVTTSSTEALRFQIRWMFYNPVNNTQNSSYNATTQSGWNGPYIPSSTGDVVANGGPILLDGWNKAITVQYVNPTGSPKDVRIVSGGPNGVVNIPAATATTSLTTANVGDDIYVSLSLR